MHLGYDKYEISDYSNLKMGITKMRSFLKESKITVLQDRDTNFKP